MVFEAGRSIQFYRPWTLHLELCLIKIIRKTFRQGTAQTIREAKADVCHVDLPGCTLAPCDDRA